jgi:hypothetical protein
VTRPPSDGTRESVSVVLLSLGHTTSPDGRLGQFQVLRGPVVVLLYASLVHSTRTGHPQSLSLSQHTLSCPLAELPSQIVILQTFTYPMDDAASRKTPSFPVQPKSNPLPLPSGVALLIFRGAKGLSSSHPTSRSSLAQTKYPAPPTPV